MGTRFTLPHRRTSVGACVALMLSTLLSTLLVPALHAADDGSQLKSPFRINYLGYYSEGPKVALFLSDDATPRAWELRNEAGAAVASGTTDDYVKGDFASGDSFFRIDFSSHTGTGEGFRLAVDGVSSERFDISASSPYDRLADESFDYFKDHRAEETTFDQFLGNWASGSLTAPFWIDAGDRGSYPTNTAVSAWLLMNLHERYPESRTPFANGVTLHEEATYGAELFYQIILPGQKLAIPKLHTEIRPWGLCPPHETGTCVSKPETKATFAVARTLAQLARLHQGEEQPNAARKAFAAARTAFDNASTLR